MVAGEVSPLEGSEDGKVIPLQAASDFASLRDELRRTAFDTIGPRREFKPQGRPTALSRVLSADAKAEARRHGIQWELTGKLAWAREMVVAEISFTLFCRDNRKRVHQTGEPIDQRIKNLLWVLDYLS